MTQKAPRFLVLFFLYESLSFVSLTFRIGRKCWCACDLIISQLESNEQVFPCPSTIVAQRRRRETEKNSSGVSWYDVERTCFFKSLVNRARERKRGESRIHDCLIRFESPGRFHRCDALLVFLELLPQVRHVLHLRLADLQIKSIGFKCQVILEDMFDEFKIFNNFFIRLEFRNSS